MAKTYDTIHAQPFGAHFKSGALAVLAALGRALDAYMTARSRSQQIERLYLKSDEQLAKMGLKREDIPRYVFRDLMHV